MLWWCAETTAVVAVLATLAALVGRWRRLGPAERHALWLIVLIKMILPPLLPAPWPRASGRGPAVGRVAVEPVAVGPIAPPMEPEADEPPLWIQADVLDLAPLAVAAAEPVPADRAEFEPEPVATPIEPVAPPPRRRSFARLGRGALWAWGLGSLVVAAAQGGRIARFARRIAAAEEAPGWLWDEAEAVGRRLEVDMPALAVLPGIDSPMLWCLGRPRLLVPPALLKSLGREGWRGVLAHELAHLRRGDPWVARLTLAAGLVWWWNPIYWLVRRRLHLEAELACDAWAVWARPECRRSYAEALIDVCATANSAAAPAPALGIAGAGRFFQRRLTMIMREHVPCRLSLRGVVPAGALALLALPSWGLAQQDEKREEPVRAEVRVERHEGEDQAGDRKESDGERRVIIRRERRDGDGPGEVEKSRDVVIRRRDGDGPADPARAKQAREDVEKLRQSLQDEQRSLQERMKESEKALRAAQERFQATMHEASQKMAEIARKMAEAERSLAEAEGRPFRGDVFRFERPMMSRMPDLSRMPEMQGMKFELRGLPADVAERVRKEVDEARRQAERSRDQAASRRGGRAQGDAPSGLERRMEELEKKLDKLMDRLGKDDDDDDRPADEDPSADDDGR